MELDELRNHGIVSSLAGAPFQLVYGVAWIAAGMLTFVAPPHFAPWLYVFMGLPAAPLAILIERKAGYLPPRKADPLMPLAMQLLFLQILAFPAILLVWDASPHYLPVAFAAIVGAHFLPYQWMYRTPIFGVLAFLVALGPYVLAIIVREQALHWTGVLVGVIMLIGAAAVRQHARATWQRMQSSGAAQPSV
ncbi:MAG: DUF7010 family protein [Phycisphaerales bacterium]